MEKRAWIKLSLLSRGVTTTAELNQWFHDQSGLVVRRNFYNSPGIAGTHAAPQEIQLPGACAVTVAVNDYGPSPWSLDWSPEAGPHLTSTWLPDSHPVELLRDLAVFTNHPWTSKVANLYGGTALSFFTPRACYFFADHTECRFCSLAGTARESDEFAGHVTADEIRGTIRALDTADLARINQVMIVGGNERDLDKGFRRQAELVRAASEALAEVGAVDTVSVHLIVMPPRDHALIDILSDLPNVHVGFNLEVWDEERFVQVAPGKHADYGRSALITALMRLRDVVGPYQAHSILIAGLEPPQSTINGATVLAADGVSPIINAFHSDRHSQIGLTIRPTYQDLAAVATGLQDLHDTYPIQPYWKGCGRNALDFEARQGLFHDIPLDLGA